MSCDSWISLSIAIATFLAVIVALFGENIRNFWFGPKLSIALSETPDLNTTHAGEKVWYYHLVVSNRHKAIANNSVVMVTRVEELWDGGSRLLWHGEVPLSWMFGKESGVFYKNIGAKQYCDIISVGKQNGLSLKIRIHPNNLQSPWKQKMNLSITVYVKSDQYTTDEKKITVNWDGEWDQGEKEMSKHLSISLQS